jgi:hypothetical protein
MATSMIYGELVSVTDIHGGVPEVYVKHLLSLKDAALQLHLQTATLRDWRQRRAHIEFVKVGGRVCVTQENIDEFIMANTLPPLPSGDKTLGSLCRSEKVRKPKTNRASSPTREGGRL